MLNQYGSNPDNSGAIIIGLLLGAIVFGAVGSAIGRSKDRSAAGFWCGALLGPIGCIIIAVMEPSDALRQSRLSEQARANAAALVTVNRPGFPGGSEPWKGWSYGTEELWLS